MATNYLLLALALPLADLRPAHYAGVRVEFVGSNSTTVWSRTVEADGPRFNIIDTNGPASEVETSLDDGATTFFDGNQTRIQTPLQPAPHVPTPAVAPGIATWIEHEVLTLGQPHPGPTIAGVATLTYTADLSYVVAIRVEKRTKRTHAKDHFELSVADIGASPAAVRVILSRGMGASLAPYHEAFRAFPLRIDGHLIQGEGAAAMTSDFRLEAVSVTPWSWPGQK